MFPKIRRSSKGSKLSGFSLIEVLLFILALGLLFLPVMHYFFGMQKSTTDSWSAVQAVVSSQSLIAKIQGTDINTVSTWNGRTDTVGKWQRTVEVKLVYVATGVLVPVPTGLSSHFYSVKVTLKGMRNETIVLSTIVEAPVFTA